MKRPSFSRELVLAFALSVAGAIGFHVAGPLMGSWLALRVLIAAVGGAFALALFAAAPTRVGRVAAVMALAVLDVGLVATHAPLWAWACSQVFALWLLRCCHFHRSAVAALADLLLAAVALGAADYALFQHGSVFLALWSYGLLQALFVFLPAALPRSDTAPATGTRFDQAQRTAEAALHRMTHV